MNQETRQGKSWGTKAARNINERISSFPNAAHDPEVLITLYIAFVARLGLLLY
jgi:hypothetical protein